MITDRNTTFDIINLHNNIQYLIKIHGVKIGQVENAIEVSAGYLSRSRNVDLPISKVISLANYFEITLDELVYGSYDKSYIISQIKALQKQLDKIEKAKAESRGET